ncbi:MAG TPA: hypothetical protein VK790_05450 [Solirubrobacteraceae bacterium]|nr:hypothetical protein [Solirubrobacteraceae bacterium]
MSNTHSPELLDMLRWTVRLGAITAPALAEHGGWALASARARLSAAERAGLLRSRRMLADAPSLYTATRAGVRVSGLHGYEPPRVSVTGAAHAIACARVAAALEHAYPDHRLMGEQELRRAEHEAGAALASARLDRRRHGAPMMHRPDLVLWPRDPQEPLPVAVEVELTIKAPRRLLEICTAWARCHCVAGTLYLAAPEVQGPLERAIGRADAGERIALVGLDAIASPVPSGA